MTTTTNPHPDIPPPALAVSCPVCRVQPGQPCRDSLGAITERHPNRHFAWDRAGRPHLSVPGMSPTCGVEGFDFKSHPSELVEVGQVVANEQKHDAGATVDFPAPEGPAMPTTTTPFPDIPLPAGADFGGTWDPDGHRDVFGIDRTVTDHKVRLYSFVSQSTDGAIELACVVVADGEREGFDLNSDQARELAAVLLEAAAELDGWTR
jgi:hypothetical protein